MKLFLVLLAISAASCEVARYVYSNGLFTMNNKPMKIDGCVVVTTREKAVMIQFMGMELSTMSPLFLTCAAFHSSIANSNVDDTLQCLLGLWNFKKLEKFKGNAIMKRTEEQAELSGKGTAEPGQSFSFKASGKRSKSLLYYGKEAGLRAKHLIGQYNSRYQAYRVATYAIIGSPYFLLKCEKWLLNGEEATLKPGVAIVGKDGKHCGVVDNEGDKFVHSNPIKKKITLDSIVMAKNYFKEGYKFVVLPDP